MPVAKSTKQKSNFENVMTIDKNGETISNTQANITSTNGVEDGLEFSVMKRKSRTGVNPATGKKMQIPAKKVPKFKAGKALKEAVKEEA